MTGAKLMKESGKAIRLHHRLFVLETSLLVHYLAHEIAEYDCVR